MPLETIKSIACFIAFVTILIVISRIRNRKERYLKKKGIAGFAKVVSIERTIYRQSGQRIYRIGLEIDVPGMPHEIIIIKKGFSGYTIDTLPKLEEIVPTLTDPANPKIVAIDYRYWLRFK